MIHLLSLVVWRLRDGTTHADAFVTAPYVWMPDSQWPLWLLYAVFVVAIALLYPMCRWYANAKARRNAAWMRYI